MATNTTYNDVLLHFIDEETDTDNILYPQSKSKLITLGEDQTEDTLEERLSKTPRVAQMDNTSIPSENLTINAQLLGGRSIEDIEALISNRASKSYVINTTLSASSWVTNESDNTDTIILSIDAIDDNTLVELALCNNTTTEQIKVYQTANIVGLEQSQGSITLKALNGKPTIDLPICIIIRGDLASSSVGETDGVTVSDEWSMGDSRTVFNEDGSITQTNGLKTIKTEFIGENIIIETLSYKGITKQKTTTFNEDGSIDVSVVVK